MLIYAEIDFSNKVLERTASTKGTGQDRIKP
jgi:hypothetical protein